MTSNDKRVLGCFSHHKCASTWFEDIYRAICSELGLKFETVYSEQDFDGDLPAFIRSRGIDFICYSNADYAQTVGIENLVGFHVVRDPRDIIVSAYFSHLKTHPTDAWPELVRYRQLLQSCNRHDGLVHEIEFRSGQFREMRSWLGFERESIVQVRMEDVTTHSYQMILHLTQHLGLLNGDYLGASERLRYLFAKIVGRARRRSGLPLPYLMTSLPAERILGIVWENDFSKKAGGRRQGEENPSSHYRKGQQGDWKNYFTEDHLKVIKERYNDLIVRLGYEVDASW